MPSWVRGSQARHPFHYPRARCITRLIIRTLLFQSTVALVRGRGAGQGRGLKCQPLSRTNRVDASSLRDERITLARRVFVIRPISPIRLIHAAARPHRADTRAWSGTGARAEPTPALKWRGSPKSQLATSALFGQRTMPDSTGCDPLRKLRGRTLSRQSGTARALPIRIVVRPARFPTRLHSAAPSAPKLTQGNAIMRNVSAPFHRFGKQAGLTPQTICV